MYFLSFYALYPLILAVSYSPFWAMYRVSDFLYFLVYKLIRYRVKVVRENLANAFPEKTSEELLQIEEGFFRYLCDLILETLKTVTWNEKTVKKRLKITDTSLLERLEKENTSYIIVMGHLGNWEWAGPCFSLNTGHQLVVIYQPLSHPYFERMLSKSRTKFNTKIVARANVLRYMIANRKQLDATALIADQAPVPIETAMWIDFLNQETPVFTGPEKIAKKLDVPVVYMDVQRVKRGYYEIKPVMISENPKESEDGAITLSFNRALEQGISTRPETWLWSHRRWKRKRKTES